MDLNKHKKEVSNFIANGDFEETPEGILVHGGIMAKGTYVHSVNGEDERRDSNIIPAEGIAHLLGVTLSDDARITEWYLAVFSGAVTPDTNWTAANFNANASEIVSGTEGYSDAARIQWVPGSVVSGVIDNLASKAVFNIACSTTINISGAGLLSSSTKGGTSGTLISASRFAAARTLNDTDAFELGYEIEIQDS